MTIRRSTVALSVLSAVLLVLVSVAVAGAASQSAFVAKLTLTGDQEVIAVAGVVTCAPPDVCGDPDAVGTAKVQIVPALDRVCVRIDWAGIDGSVWGAHIHGPATTQTAAPILVPFLMLTPGGADNLAGTDSLDVCVTDADADAIAANPSAYYLNVHSFPDFNPGAIRAQLSD
jgi:CHRD domain